MSDSPPPRRRLRIALGALAALGALGLLGWGLTRHRCDSPTAIERALQGTDLDARREAARCLNHSPAVPLDRGRQLAYAALTDPDPIVRKGAVGFLQWRVRQVPESVVTNLIALLDDADPRTSDRAARTLGHVKVQTLGRVPKLIELLERSDASNGCRSAAFLMGMLVGVAPTKLAPAVPGLIRAIEGSDAALRNKAVWSLREYGPAAATAAPALARLLDDPEETTRSMAAETLGKIGAAAVPHLSPVLERRDGAGKVARRCAVDALWRLSDAGVPESYPVLAGLLTDADKDVRDTARVALVLTKGSAVEAPLVERIGGPDTALSREAVLTLGWRRGPPLGPEARAALEAQRASDDPGVRGVAALGLAHGLPYAQAAPYLNGVLTTSAGPQARCGAARRLEKWGATALPSLPALERATADDHPEVRIAAARAIAALVPARETAMTRAIIQDIHWEHGLRGTALAAIHRIAGARRAAGRTPLWWVVPLVYRWQLLLLLALSLVWFAVHARWPKRRPASRPGRAIYVLLIASAPAALWGVAAYGALDANWVRLSLPELHLLVLPFRWSAITSLTAVCLLAALFVTIRKPAPEPSVAPEEPLELGVAGPVDRVGEDDRRGEEVEGDRDPGVEEAEH